MTKQIEMVTWVQRRRRWPLSQEERIVAAAMAPGAVAGAIEIEQVGTDPATACVPAREW